MDIQSVIQISKHIEVQATDEFGGQITRQIGFLASSIDKVGQQCVVNIQIFEKERFDDFKEEIQQQTYDFFAHLSACVRDSNLNVLNNILPSDSGINKKVAKMSL